MWGIAYTHTPDSTLQDQNSKLFDYALEIGKLKEEKMKLAEKAESLERQLRESKSTLRGLKPASLSNLAKYSQLQSHNDQLHMSLSKEMFVAGMSPTSYPSSTGPRSRSQARADSLEFKRVSDKHTAMY